jgi:hypothetical protein
MLIGSMQEGGPDDPRQAVQVTRYYAMLVEAAVPDEIIEHEDKPANGCQRDYGDEAH